MVIEQVYNYNLKCDSAVISLQGPNKHTPETIVLGIGPSSSTTMAHMTIEDFRRFTENCNHIMSIISRHLIAKEVA